MLIAGIGCRSSTSTAMLAEALDTALAQLGLDVSALAALATGSNKALEAGLVELSAQLHLPLLLADRQQLASVEARLATHSPISHAASGSGSLSEAAALVFAGANARLLAPRFNHQRVSIALAATAGDFS